MSESKTVTGNRDDLVVDASRCLRMRFSESSCGRCAAMCPHGAVALDGGLSINPEVCRGCLLCTSVCPVGALEQKGDFYACLAQLSRVPEPVLGCIRTKEHSNATLACLGGLSEEHLLSLCHSLPGELTLNLSNCDGCPNRSIVQHLRRCLTTLSQSGLLDSGSRIVSAGSAEEIHYREESVDRRSFFKSFRTSIVTSAAALLSTNNEQTELRTPYAGKRVPARRALLNSTRIRLSRELGIRVQEQFDSRVSFDQNCSSCQGCIAICPTGALQTRFDEVPPVFDQSLCTGCELCREFCLEGAVRIRSGISDDGAP
jgi:ferredoxin